LRRDLEAGLVLERIEDALGEVLVLGAVEHQLRPGAADHRGQREGDEAVGEQAGDAHGKTSFQWRGEGVLQCRSCCSDNPRARIPGAGMTTVLKNAAQLVGAFDADERCRRGAAMRSPGVVENGALVMSYGRIDWLG